MDKEKLKKLASIFRARFTGAELSSMSVLIAFYLLLSIFPLVVVVGNILPYLHIDPAAVIEFIDTLVPDVLEPVLEPIIRDLLTRPNGGLLSIGALGLLWAASKGVNYLQLGMNRAYGIKAKTSFIAKRVISLVTVLLIMALVVAFMLVFSFGELFLEWLSSVVSWAGPVSNVLGSLKWPVTFVFMLCLLTLVYVITPDTRVRIRDAWPGSLLATVGLLALTEAFALYVRFATRLVMTYGALSTFFVLMFWLDFSAMLIMAGAVLNASIQEYRCGKAVGEDSGIDRILEEHVIKKVISKLRKSRDDTQKPGGE